MKGILWLVCVVYLVRAVLVGVGDACGNIIILEHVYNYSPVLNWSGPVLVFNGI